MLRLFNDTFLSFDSYGEIYKWVDEDGRVHFGDNKNRPKNTNAEKIELTTNTYKSVSFESSHTRTDQVIMYSTSWCGYCKKAKKYFIANQIPFIEYDIERDGKAKRNYTKLGATGVPVILYKDQRMNGFSVKGFKRIYEAGNNH